MTWSHKLWLWVTKPFWFYNFLDKITLKKNRKQLTFFHIFKNPSYRLKIISWKIFHQAAFCGLSKNETSRQAVSLTRRQNVGKNKITSSQNCRQSKAPPLLTDNDEKRKTSLGEPPMLLDILNDCNWHRRLKSKRFNFHQRWKN